MAKRIINSNLSSQERKKFLAGCRNYLWDEPYLFQIGPDEMLRKCVPEEEQTDILKFCHELPCGGHFAGRKTTHKVLQSGFFWPSLFDDAHLHVKSCDRCQRAGNISKRDEMSLTNNLVSGIRQLLHIGGSGLCI